MKSFKKILRDASRATDFDRLVADFARLSIKETITVYVGLEDMQGAVKQHLKDSVMQAIKDSMEEAVMEAFEQMNQEIRTEITKMTEATDNGDDGTDDGSAVGGSSSFSRGKGKGKGVPAPKAASRSSTSSSSSSSSGNGSPAPQSAGGSGSSSSGNNVLAPEASSSSANGGPTPKTTKEAVVVMSPTISTMAMEWAKAASRTDGSKDKGDASAGSSSSENYGFSQGGASTSSASSGNSIPSPKRREEGEDKRVADNNGGMSAGSNTSAVVGNGAGGKNNMSSASSLISFFGNGFPLPQHQDEGEGEGKGKGKAVADNTGDVSAGSSSTSLSSQAAANPQNTGFVGGWNSGSAAPSDPSLGGQAGSSSHMHMHVPGAQAAPPVVVEIEPSSPAAQKSAIPPLTEDEKAWYTGAAVYAGLEQNRIDAQTTNAPVSAVDRMKALLAVIIPNVENFPDGRVTDDDDDDNEHDNDSVVSGTAVNDEVNFSPKIRVEPEEVNVSANGTNPSTAPLPPVLPAKTFNPFAKGQQWSYHDFVPRPKTDSIDSFNWADDVEETQAQAERNQYKYTPQSDASTSVSVSVWDPRGKGKEVVREPASSSSAAQSARTTSTHRLSGIAQSRWANAPEEPATPASPVLKSPVPKPTKSTNASAGRSGQTDPGKSKKPRSKKSAGKKSAVAGSSNNQASSSSSGYAFPKQASNAPKGLRWFDKF